MGDVEFAVVLLTLDVFGAFYKASKVKKHCARQNVVLELDILRENCLAIMSVPCTKEVCNYMLISGTWCM